MSKIAVYPGSFNPFHAGHLYVVREALKVFDQVIVAVGQNENKNVGSDLAFAQKNLSEDELRRVQLDFYGGKLVDYLAELAPDAVIRGLRTERDFIYERGLLHHVKPSIPVFFVIASAEVQNISSSEIRWKQKPTFLTEE